MGRSQLNATTENPPTDSSTAAGASAKVPPTPPAPDPGEAQTMTLFHFPLLHLSVQPTLPVYCVCIYYCLQDNFRLLPQHKSSLSHFADVRGKKTCLGLIFP